MGTIDIHRFCIVLFEKAFKKTTEEAFKGLNKEDKEIYYKVVETIKENLLSLPSGAIETSVKKSKNRK